MEATRERKPELVIVDTLTDKYGRTVKVGYRAGDVEIIVTPHSGHDGRMAFDGVGRTRFIEAWRAATLQAAAIEAAAETEGVAFRRPDVHDERRRRAHLDGINAVERAARDLIGIPDSI